jgi:hypothetical protein
MSSVRRTHQVPTHLKVEETLLTIAGLSLSARQFLVVLIGLALGYQLWSWLSWPAAPLVLQILRWGLATIPLVCALAVAFVRLAARSLDRWCVVVLSYLLRPRLLLWRSIRFAEPLAMVGLVEEEEEDA